VHAVPAPETKGLLDEPADVLERMRRQAGQLGRVELTRAADIVNAGLTEMRGATAPRLLLELICARVLLPVGAGSGGLADLLVRVERLERRLQMAEPPAPRRATGTAGAAASTGATTAAPASPPSVPARAASSQPGPVTPAPATTPAAAPPGPAVPPEGAVTPPAPPVVGELDAAAVRRRWDEVLDVTKRRRRATHAVLVSGPAHVVDIAGGVLTVGFPTGPLQRQFELGGANEEVLREALREVLGTDWRVRATLVGSGERVRGGADFGRDREVDITRESADDFARESVDDIAGESVDDGATDEETGLALLQRHLGATVIDDGEAG
jgi:DNA polymerase-3 subunit gamma/tau